MDDGEVRVCLFPALRTAVCTRSHDRSRYIRMGEVTHKRMQA
jgi:hypothetical protein